MVTRVKEEDLHGSFVNCFSLRKAVKTEPYMACAVICCFYNILDLISYLTALINKVNNNANNNNNNNNVISLNRYVNKGNRFWHLFTADSLGWMWRMDFYFVFLEAMENILLRAQNWTCAYRTEQRSSMSYKTLEQWERPTGTLCWHKSKRKLFSRVPTWLRQ